MILAGVNLPDDPTNTRAVVSQQHEEVFDDESLLRQLVDQFHVRQALLIGADLVPALNDVYPLVSKNPVGLIRRFELQVKNGLVILLSRSIPGGVVLVIIFIVLVVDVR